MELPYRGSGDIFFNDNKYRCDLYYSEKLGGIVIKVNVKNEKIIGNFLELPIEISCLHGQLDSGFHFALLDLFRTSMQDLVSYGTSVYTFEAKHILCGFNKEEQIEPTFYKVEYVLSNIVEWGEMSIYEIGEKHELISKIDDVKNTVYKNSDFSITYLVRGSFLPFSNRDLLKESIKLEQFGVVEIEFNTERNLNSFDDVFMRLQRLVEIASLHKINVEKVYAYSKNIHYDIQERTIERAIEVYGRNIKEAKESDTKLGRSWHWITLTELINQNSFEKYFDKYEKLEPIIELFLEPFHSQGLSTRRMFLNIVQALETYHSRFVATTLKEFKDRVNDLIKALSGEQQEKTKEFLLANSRGFITLESRVSDLLLANWQIHFDTGEINHEKFPSVIAHSRHYYTHYDENIKQKERILTEEELQIYNRALLKILEYYILLELGFSEDDTNVRGKLNERWGNISQELEILKLSREKQE